MTMIKRFFIASIFILTVFSAQAQLISGVGVMGGLTYSRQKWFLHATDETMKQKFLLRYNGEVFVEWFSHDYFRIQSELQYNMKGTRVRETGEKYKLDYFAFNNFLKIRNELYSIIPYALVGPRIEYTFRSNEEGSRPLHFGWSGGVGFETVTFGSLALLSELHYNPDIDKAGKNELFDYKNRAWELRVGVKFKFRDKTDDCPPTY
jgi:hypothetical protein